MEEMALRNARFNPSMAVPIKRDGDDADDDAQRRQHRAHLVGADRAPGNAQTLFELGEEVHVRGREEKQRRSGFMAYALAATGSLALGSRPLALLFVAGDQAVADAKDAPRVFGDVFLVRHHDDGVALLREFAQTAPGFPSPVLVSRLPVGSSASRMEGRLTSARATATRWRWPPDSSLGR